MTSVGNVSCNKRKAAAWLHNGPHMILHYYYYTIPVQDAGKRSSLLSQREGAGESQGTSLVP